MFVPYGGDAGASSYFLSLKQGCNEFVALIGGQMFVLHLNPYGATTIAIGSLPATDVKKPGEIK